MKSVNVFHGGFRGTTSESVMVYCGAEGKVVSTEVETFEEGKTGECKTEQANTEQAKIEWIEVEFMHIQFKVWIEVMKAYGRVIIVPKTDGGGNNTDQDTLPDDGEKRALVESSAQALQVKRVKLVKGEESQVIPQGGSGGKMKKEELRL